MTTQPLSSPDLRAPLWIALIALISVAFSSGFACATPFAAFAAAAALTLRTKQAFAMIGSAWIANQLVGYMFLGYPQDGQSLVWGLAIGASAFAATGASIYAVRSIKLTSTIAQSSAVIVASIIAYQACMLVAALALDGMAGNSLAIVARVTAIDIAAFALLLAIHALGKTLDIVPSAHAN